MRLDDDSVRRGRVFPRAGARDPASQQVPLTQTELRGQEAGGGERAEGGEKGGQGAGGEEAQQVQEEDRERQGAGAYEEVQPGL